MQLLKIALYNLDGRIRNVDFLPGKLNIVTGRSRTGKSAILSIVDYCLGRDKVEMPPGVIRKHVKWFGTLWQLDDGSRIFLGRPALDPGRSETSKMMVTFGGPQMDVPALTHLVVNSDSDSARAQVAARIGLVDAKVVAPEGAIRGDTAINLGSAVIYCFQEQHEVANKALLFHRQDDPAIATRIRDTLPYYLGAVPGDNAAKHASLRNAKRELRAARRDAQATLDDAEQIHLKIASLLVEAHEVGMISIASAPDTRTAVEVLSSLRTRTPEPLSSNADLESQNRRRVFESESATLRSDLGQLLDDRALLLDVAQGEGGFGQAIGKQAQRLSSLNLLPGAAGYVHDQTCPVCRQPLKGEDPTPRQLNRRLEALRGELDSMARAEPNRRSALDAIDAQAKEYRERLVIVESALRQIEGVEPGQRSGAERREFVRGRVDATLDQYQATDESSIQTLMERIEGLERRIAALEADLDDDLADQRLRKVVTKLSRRITEIAQLLEVENADDGVWLELSKLTVILDTDTGPATLNSLGSGANWVGIHLAVHLALHELFVAENRPVPRLLMIDQPTQVFYESQYVGDDELTADEDHDAVSRMFRLMFDVVEKHAPGLQLIVSDHANLNETWFADSVQHNWRNGDGLIPADWITENRES
jgi:hypothetical protein